MKEGDPGIRHYLHEIIALEPERAETKGDRSKILVRREVKKNWFVI